MSIQLQAASLDYLAWITWSKTKDGAANRNRPKPVLDALLGRIKEEPNIIAFNSPAEFWAARERITGGQYG